MSTSFLAALVCASVAVLADSPARAGDSTAPEIGQTEGGITLAQGARKKKKKKSRKHRSKKGGSKGEKSDEAEKAPPPPAATTASFGAAARVGYMYNGPGFGAEGFYILSPSIQLGGQFLMKPSSEVKATGDALYLEYASLGITSFGARARYFVWGSHYILAGGTYDSVSGQYGFTETASGKLYYTDYTATALMLQVGVGSLFKFGAFVLGADWITLTLPLSVSASAVETSVLDADGNEPAIDPLAAEGKELNPTIADMIKKQLQFQAVMIYAGYTF